MDLLLQTACETIADGAVLLKNENGVLPLNMIHKIAFWGKNSKSMLECGSGSTNVITAVHSNVYEETERLLGKGKVVFEQWDDAEVLVYTVSASSEEGADRDRMAVDCSTVYFYIRLYGRQNIS